jgi:hypothetical protein
MADSFEKYDETLRLTEDMLKGSLAAIQLQRQALALTRNPFQSFTITDANPMLQFFNYPLGANNNE